MKLKFVFVTALVLLIGTAAFMLYAVSRVDTETVILCATGEGGIRIPSRLCEYALYHQRDTAADVAVLSQGAGLVFVLSSEHPEKYRIAEFLIANGLDVNGVNHFGDYPLTPLYSAILFNDVAMARFLLDHGADGATKQTPLDMTPQAFARALQRKDPSIDRSAMIAVLSE